jgi:hypothetical protein
LKILNTKKGGTGGVVHVVECLPSKCEALIKIKRLKGWAGRVAPVVEHLPSKYEALNTNPSTAKKKKKKVES